MACDSKQANECMFSIELKSKGHVKSLAFPNENEGNVLIEGFLGKLKNLSFIEGILLEIEGTNGILRMDFDEKELQVLLSKKDAHPKNINKENENLTNAKATRKVADCVEPQFRGPCSTIDKWGGEKT